MPIKSNDISQDCLINHQNLKLEKDFKLTTSSEIIAKNNYLKNLYFIGFNSKPVNKVIINSIDISDAIETIKSFIENQELSIKSCGPLILGLCKIYEKKIKLYYDELENMVKLNKDKKTLKAEKIKDDKIKNNNDLTKNFQNYGNEKSISKKTREKNNLGATNDNIVNDNIESHYDEMFLSTNLNLNTNSKSLRDFSMENNNTKKIFNLFDISELNSQLSNSLTKLNITNFDKEQTPSKMPNIFDIEYETSNNKIDALRAKESIIGNSSSVNNLDSNSRFLNSGNHLINGLVDKSNFEDEMFNKNLNQYFLNILYDNNENFKNIDNIFNAEDGENIQDEEININKIDTNLSDLINNNTEMPKKLDFSNLKNKLELEFENPDNLEKTFEANLLKKSRKKIRSKIKKINFEIDDDIYLNTKLPAKSKENYKAKKKQFKSLKQWEKLDYDLQDYLEIREKFEKELYLQDLKSKFRDSIVLFDKDLSNSFRSMQIISEVENVDRVKEEEFRPNITKIKEFLLQNDHDTFKILKFFSHNHSTDPSEVFENRDFLEEKINILFEEDDNYSLKDQEKEYEYENKKYEMEDNIHEKIEDFNDFNENQEQTEELIVNLKEQANVSFNIEDPKINKDLKSTKKNSDIDKEILKYMKKKKSNDLKFKNLNDNLTYNPADVFYRILSLAQREKIEIVQNEINDIDQIFIKLL